MALRWRQWPVWWSVGACFMLGTGGTVAFEVALTDKPGEYLKWGESKKPGTSGGVVTWGFVPAGTQGGAYCGDFCVGKSLASLPNFYPHPERSNIPQSVELSELRGEFQSAFDAWAAVADLKFEFVGEDRSDKAMSGPTSTAPMIRIGIWKFGGLSAYFTAGAALPPGLRDQSGSGHIFLNSNVGFQRGRVEEGSRLQDFPVGGGLHMTDLYLLALHEVGHVIGLAGSDVPESVMQSGGTSAVLRPMYLRRLPRADDIAGAQFLYGPPRKAAPGTN